MRELTGFGEMIPLEEAQQVDESVYANDEKENVFHKEVSLIVLRSNQNHVFV